MDPITWHSYSDLNIFFQIPLSHLSLPSSLSPIAAAPPVKPTASSSSADSGPSAAPEAQDGSPAPFGGGGGRGRLAVPPHPGSLLGAALLVPATSGSASLHRHSDKIWVPPQSSPSSPSPSSRVPLRHPAPPRAAKAGAAEAAGGGGHLSGNAAPQARDPGGHRAQDLRGQLSDHEGLHLQTELVRHLFPDEVQRQPEADQVEPGGPLGGIPEFAAASLPGE